MLGTGILALSTALQIISALLAARLTRVTHWRLPWLAMAFAIALMAARRGITLFQVIAAHDASRHMDLTAESVALLISVLMLVGVTSIEPLFLRHERAETALKKSELRYRQLVEQASDGIFVSNPEGRYISVNSRACELLGYTRDELLALNLRDLIPPEDLDSDPPQLEPLRQGATIVRERRMLRRDGSVLPVEISAKMLADGNLQGIVRDVSERKAAEKRLQEATATLQAVFEYAPLAITVIDPDGKLRMWNPWAERMFGWKASEVLGKPLPIVPPEGHKEHMRFRKMLIEEGATVSGAVLRRMRKDGSTLVVRLDTAPLRDASGKITGLMGVLADISEQVMLEEQLRQAQKMEAVGQLAGGIAHDFNNLLTAITGYAELVAADAVEGTPTARRITHILQSASRAESLTRQLLAYSRQQVLQPKVLDVNDVVLDVEPILRRLIGENIELSFTLAEGLPAVLADPTQLDQVIMNLALNARDAMPEGGKLVVETREARVGEVGGVMPIGTAPGSYLALSVRDTGTGMSEETKRQIFEPFFTTKEQGRGTGLGLATVYGIVKQTGGTIRVDSAPGKGAKFTIYLPRASADAEVTEETREEEPTLQKGTESILLVEDEPMVRELACEVLTEAGYAVTTAGSGEEALALVEGGRTFDVLMTDVVLPSMNGKQLAEKMAELMPAVRVLFASGYADQTLIGDGGLGDGAPFLQKPYTVRQLCDKVREVVEAGPGDNHVG